MIFYYWYFKDIGYKFEPYVCNRCHNVSMMAYEFENIAILNVKGALWNMTKLCQTCWNS